MAEQAQERLANYEGRGPDGRFAPGNKGGPGNPYARQSARLRAAAMEELTEQDMKDLMRALHKLALKGDTAAARLLVQCMMGASTSNPHPDELDAHEVAVQKAAASKLKIYFHQLAEEPLPEANLALLRHERALRTMSFREELLKVCPDLGAEVQQETTSPPLPNGFCDLSVEEIEELAQCNRQRWAEEQCQSKAPTQPDDDPPSG